LQRIARDVVTPDISDKEVRDWCNDLWGKPVSPIIKSSLALKRRATSDTPNPRNRTWSITEKSSRKRARTSETQLLMTPQPSVLATRTNVNDSNRLPHPTIHTPDFQNSQLTLRIQKATISVNVLGVTNPPPYNSTFEHVQLEPGTVTAGPSCITRQLTSDLPSPGMVFLEHALVWFAKPSGCASGSSYWSWKNSFPRQQRLHSVESLLTGCGWHIKDPSSAWAKRGVVFVDESDMMGKKWKSYAMEAIEERRARLTIIRPSQSRKPIWIFDIKTWTFGKCDIQSHALACLE
jgi:DNA ligase-4